MKPLPIATLTHKKFNSYDENDWKEQDRFMAVWTLVDKTPAKVIKIEFYKHRNYYCCVTINNLKDIYLIGNARSSTKCGALIKVLRNIGINFEPLLSVPQGDTQVHAHLFRDRINSQFDRHSRENNSENRNRAYY